MKLGEINSFLTIACVSLPSTTENEKKKGQTWALVNKEILQWCRDKLVKFRVTSATNTSLNPTLPNQESY